jgi:signal peptidase I
MKPKSIPPSSSAKQYFLGIYREYRSTALFLFLFFCIRSSFADWSPVPTGSMIPTILEGDVITINKAAYDIRVPFTHISLLKTNEPVRGDIVVFDSKVSDKRLVKRLIGLPGDIIAMKNNQLIINGKPVQYEIIDDDLVEHLDKKSHKIYLLENADPTYQSFAEVKVPEGYYLMLGDSRDNSVDSRFIGFVPRKELVGRAGGVAISFDMNNFYIPRKNRLWSDLR